MFVTPKSAFAGDPTSDRDQHVITDEFVSKMKWFLKTLQAAGIDSVGANGQILDAKKDKTYTVSIKKASKETQINRNSYTLKY